MDKYRTYDEIDLAYSSAEEVVNKINEAWEKYGKANVLFDVSTEHSYGDSYGTCTLHCYRAMTKEEKENKIREDKAFKERQEEWDKQAYERLKKKYENR